MIRREDVADLRPGDVVEYRRDDWPEGCYVHSPLKAGDGVDSGLYVLDGYFGVRTPDGRPYEDMATLTVVSLAPRPLYVNHDRAEPVSGDVARAADGAGIAMFMYRHGNGVPNWRWPNGLAASPGRHGLTLLVDGETGQIVP